MKRRNFIKRLFGAVAAATTASVAPALAKENKETYKIEDIFSPCCPGNSDLFYLKKDSWLQKEIEDIAGERLVDRKYFMYYNPLSHLIIPIKDEYTRDDFQHILNWLKMGEYEHFHYYCNGTGNGGVEYGAMRMFRDKKHGYFKIDMFDARKPNID